MSDPTTLDIHKLAEAISEKSAEARACCISTEETLGMLAVMGVDDPEAELRQFLRCLNHRPGSGLRA